MEFIFTFITKTLLFIFDNIEINNNKNGDTQISLNINKLLRRAIYACVKLF